LTPETGDAGLTLEVYKQSGGRWSDIGQIDVVCADSVAALRAGQLKLVPRAGVDVELAGRRLMLIPSSDPSACDSASPSPHPAAAKVSPVSQAGANPER